MTKQITNQEGRIQTIFLESIQNGALPVGTRFRQGSSTKAWGDGVIEGYTRNGRIEYYAVRLDKTPEYVDTRNWEKHYWASWELPKACSFRIEFKDAQI